MKFSSLAESPQHPIGGEGGTVKKAAVKSRSEGEREEGGKEGGGKGEGEKGDVSSEYA
jgi:hypothetical protein